LSVSQIEQLTGLKFYSNLPLETQQIIKSSAATSSFNVLPNVVFSSQTTIGHNGVEENDLFASTRELTTSQISIGEVSPGHWDAAQAGTTQISSGQINKLQRGAAEPSITQIGVDKFRVVEGRERQIAPTQVGIGQIAGTKVSLSQVGAAKINASQNIFDDVGGVLKVPTAQFDVAQIQIGEVSSSLAIEFPQFLSSHALHLQTSVDKSFSNNVPLTLTPATLTSATTSPGTGLINGSFNSTQLGNSNYSWDSRDHWTLPPTSSHLLGLQRNIENWGDWRSWQVSVNDIEQITNLSFFSHLPQEVQSRLKSRNGGSFSSAAPTGVSNRASLRPFEGDVTAVGSSVVIPGRITYNETNAVSEVSSIDNGLSPINSGQIGFDERGAVASGENHIGISEIGALEVGSVERAFSQGDPFKVGKPKIGIGEIGVGEGPFSQVNPLETGSHQRCLGETAFSQVCSSKINAIESGIPEFASDQYDSLQVSTGEFPSSEVALPASVTLQQLFGTEQIPHTSSHGDFGDSLANRLVQDGTYKYGLDSYAQMSLLSGQTLLTENQALISRFSQTFLVDLPRIL
jgi:hypothetical protein